MIIVSWNIRGKSFWESFLSIKRIVLSWKESLERVMRCFEQDKKSDFEKMCTKTMKQLGSLWQLFRRHQVFNLPVTNIEI